jgi:actin-related protein
MSDDDEAVEAVVIDNGSGTFLAGFASDVSPQSIIRPSVVGRRKCQVMYFILWLGLWDSVLS